MDYFDLHCDTVTECFVKDIAFRENSLHVNLEKARLLSNYVQCCAVWLPDSLHGPEAFERFCAVADKFSEEAAKNEDLITVCKQSGDLAGLQEKKRYGMILTVENASALGGDLKNVQEFKRRGVKMCTLTWNGENELGRGVMAKGSTGITEFGRKAVAAFEEAGIILDISHASEELFWDVAELTQTPLVASHSNAKMICGHPRNLTDRQFEAVKASGGLVGLNFYTAFLNDEPEKSSMEDILRHAEHFLSLGGEDVLSMGGDMDGSQLPSDMEDGLAAIPKLYEAFLRHNYSEELVRRLFFGNALRFFRRNADL